MLVPIRCVSCGSLIAEKYRSFVDRVKAGEDSAGVMDDLGMKRYCCRRMLLGTVETIHQIIPYYEALKRRREEVAHELE